MKTQIVSPNRWGQSVIHQHGTMAKSRRPALATVVGGRAIVWEDEPAVVQPMRKAASPVIKATVSYRRPPWAPLVKALRAPARKTKQARSGVDLSYLLAEMTLAQSR